MEKTDLVKIIMNLDSSNGRRTKIEMLRTLSLNGELNNFELSRIISKSQDHTMKFLNWLYSCDLVTHTIKTKASEYRYDRTYTLRSWKLTKLGEEFVKEIEGIDFNPTPTPISNPSPTTELSTETQANLPNPTNSIEKEDTNNEKNNLASSYNG